nr:WEB family protein At1g75720-like [Ipomoea batatas]
MLKAMEGQGGGARSVRMTRKAEIDTSPPFRSVKEAVMMFGDTLLAGELYATKLKQMNEFGSGKNDGVPMAELGNVTAELEETKQTLEKAQEESLIMATCLSSLQDELERTKKELRQLKAEQKKSDQSPAPAVEEENLIKSIEVSSEFDLKSADPTKPENNNNNIEFQKKRYVTFANPPSVVARVMVPESDDARLERLPSMKKKKRSSIPLIGGLLSRIKGAATARA